MFYNNYCKGSKIHMPVCKPLVRFGGGGKSTEFMCLIWSYSSMFDHSSLGVKVDDSINRVRGPCVFRACHK